LGIISNQTENRDGLRPMLFIRPAGGFIENVPCFLGGVLCESASNADHHDETALQECAAYPQ
jgi:hypothetical protein